MRALLNGFNLHYLVAGSAGGPAVTFVHGFPFSLEMWRSQVDAASSAGFRAVAYDVRGHGLSDVGDGQYTIEGHVDDLFALLDHLKIPMTAIVGLSMGGYIALRALQREPGRFTAAVLCDTRSEADTDEGRLRRAASVRTVKKNGSAAYAADYVKSMFTEESFLTRPAVVDSIRQIIARTPPLSLAGTLIALAARTDTTSSLSSISIPTMILVGERDTVTPLFSSQSMQAKIRGSELHIVPGAAHLSNLENPGFFNEKLLAFLKKALPGH
jgi:pimeloyl-ACP methyl ester carboxylesterase